MEGQDQGHAATTATATPAAVKRTSATAKLKIEYKIDPDQAQQHATALVSQLREMGMTVTADFVAHEPRKAAL